ncbi:MAG: hypothetical protein LBD45_09580 [Bacteroidales bacterium]|jgi:hypothetical protein|nr:hypothetical protein [Bacteroidales bacterium]
MKKFQAIMWVVATVCLAIGGFMGYSDGSSYITWFGIKLSEGGFIFMIIVFVIIDISVLINAFSKDKFIAEMDEKAQETETVASDLSAPCTVSLTRPSKMTGWATGVRVFLNGVEQEKLRNGETVRMETVFSKNKLSVRYNNADEMVRSVNFDAQAGGHVRIELQYVKGELTVIN